jgi:hypothetical protein
MELPPLELLQIYQDLLERGRIAAIALEVKTLAEGDSNYEVFANKVSEACGEFDLESLQALLFETNSNH